MCPQSSNSGSAVPTASSGGPEQQEVEALRSRVLRLTAELEQANRELESLSYSVSHDLRAPLRAIDGFSRILEEDYADRLDGEAMRVISVIRDSSARLAGLIEELLAFSRLSRKPMSIEAVDMFRMAREAFQEACVGAPRLPELVLHSLPAARGDASLLKQLWVNLLANAVKFTGPQERASIEVSAREEEAEIVFSVRDNGVGFDMRYHDKLFGVFQRLHPEEEFPGTGMGLAVAQRVLTRHGGRIWAQGAPGKGATFHFSLPKEAPGA